MNLFPATASALEIVWLIDVLIGLGMAVYMVDFWLEKRRRLDGRQRDRARRIALNAHLFRKTYYLLCHVWFITVGLMLASLPPGGGTHPHGLRLWASVALILMLLFTAIGMQIDMVQAYIRYRKIEDDWNVRD